MLQSPLKAAIRKEVGAMTKEAQKPDSRMERLGLCLQVGG